MRFKCEVIPKGTRTAYFSKRSVESPIFSGSNEFRDDLEEYKFRGFSAFIINNFLKSYDPNNRNEIDHGS